MAGCLDSMCERLRFGVVDAVSSLLQDVRTHSAVFNRSLMRPPWSLRFVNRAPLTLVGMLRGQGWLVPAVGEHVRLTAGDTALLVGGGPFTIADDPASPTSVTIYSDESCVATDGTSIGEDTRLDHFSWGTDAAAPDAVLTCDYQVSGEVGRRVLSVLPPVVPSSNRQNRARAEIDLVLAELTRPAPGHQVVLDRILDLLLVSTLRDWFTRADPRVPGWYRAMDDPVVGEALRLMHDEPQHPWTVGGLAERCGVSRAAFARRFTDLVGEPPMAYLTGWRMALAADLLRQTGDTVGAIARRVGYGDAFALSVAFTRAHGVRPSVYRAASTEPVNGRARAHEPRDGSRRPEM